MRLFYILFCSYTLAHLYVFISMRRAFGGGKWQIPVAVWLLAMASAWFLRFGKSMPSNAFSDVYQNISHVWMGLLIFLCYCLLAADLLTLLTRLAARISGSGLAESAAALLVPPRRVPAACVAGILIFCVALWSAQTLRVTEITVTTAKLPPDAPPLRIVAAADVHIGPFIGPRTLTRIADKAASLQPDIFLLAGDLVDMDLSGDTEHAAILRSIPARLGKIAVTGNHEAYRGPQMSLDFLSASGFRVLREEALELGGITVAGIDDDTFAARMPSDTANAARLLADLPSDRFTLFLNHKPQYSLETVGLFDFQFSGHTHGGQFWPGIHFTRSIFKLPQGLSTLRSDTGESRLFITNGTGFWGPPIRLFAPPEIVLIIITPQH